MADRPQVQVWSWSLQDESLANYPAHFRAFIAWNYQPDGTELGGVRASGFDYLRTIATIIGVAVGVLVNISASKSLFQLQEMYDVMDVIKAFAAESATVIAGTVYDEALGDELRVTIVATGLGKAHARTVMRSGPPQRQRIPRSSPPRSN